MERDVRDRSFGRVRLRFITNHHAADLPSARQNTSTGTVAVSAPALTALDLANRPDHGGALHNVATVLIDLATDGMLDDAEIAKLVHRLPVAASRRVGWIVERLLPTCGSTRRSDATPGGSPSGEVPGLLPDPRGAGQASALAISILVPLRAVVNVGPRARSTRPGS